MAGLVATIRDRCQRCYNCVRHCPAKAIKVEDGQAKVIEERCIACGNCVRVCTQSAKEIRSDIGPVQVLLRSGEHVIAALAPSFPVSFYPHRSGQAITSLRRLGFDEVVEVAFGADLVARDMARLHAEGRYPLLITTPCPAAVAYVEKYVPSLVPYLAPIVSPMIAIARVVKWQYRPDARVVFIGPCIAKKGEMDSPEVAGLVDAVLTFRELDAMLDAADIDVASLPDSELDGPVADVGRIFPLTSGLLRTAGVGEDPIDHKVVVTHGRASAMRLFEELELGAAAVRLADVLFCEGCVDGPRIQSRQGMFVRGEILARYVRERHTPENAARARASLMEYSGIDLSRSFTAHPVRLLRPTEGEIRAALARVNKTRPEDELNCGACGYDTCREKAIAVCQGLAESEMCLPHLIDLQARSYRRLEGLHIQLQEAQGQLIQAEKLASMGQLAAGIAHEINNPLGTILLYSNLLLERLPPGDERHRRLELMAQEAERCRDIVAGLLDFARQTRLVTQMVDLNALLAGDLEMLSQQPLFAGIKVRTELDRALPRIEADPSQLKDVFRNLLINAAEAMGGNGRLTVRTAALGESVRVQVQDTGCGIPPENLERVFQPFFTTKELGEGTGLGLAIAYGVVKIHRGQIEVESQVGVGTTFTVTLLVRLGVTKEALLGEDE